MSHDRWDMPSEKLRRIAEAQPDPRMRDCPSCIHRHPKGQRCGYPDADSPCRCDR